MSTDLILRSMRAIARMRLEGWPGAPSFIVAVLRDAWPCGPGPQDEVPDG